MSTTVRITKEIIPIIRECRGACVVVYVEDLSEEELAAIVGAICNPNGETVQ